MSIALLKTCECCRAVRAVTRRRADPRGAVLMGIAVAGLCKQCAEGNPDAPSGFSSHRMPHVLSGCLFCGARVWTCAQLEHIRQVHPRIWQRRMREPEDKPREPSLKYLGTLDMNKLERGD